MKRLKKILAWELSITFKCLLGQSQSAFIVVDCYHWLLHDFLELILFGVRHTSCFICERDSFLIENLDFTIEQSLFIVWRSQLFKQLLRKWLSLLVIFSFRKLNQLIAFSLDSFWPFMNPLAIIWPIICLWLPKKIRTSKIRT